MASYTSIETGYKPEYALGAIYAGQNAANAQSTNNLNNIAQLFDNQAKMQSFQQDERMNPLRVAQIQGTNQTTSLANQLSEGQLPELLAKSGLNLQQITYLMQNGGAKALAEGQIGEAQSKAATGAYDTAVNPSKILGGISDNQTKVVGNQQKISIIAAENAAQQKASGVPVEQIVLGLMQDPNLPAQTRTVTIQALRGGYLPALIKEMVNSIGQRQTMQKTDAEIAGRKEVAQIGANATTAAADRTARGMETAAFKAQIGAMVQLRKQDLDRLKQEESRIDGDLNNIIIMAGGDRAKAEKNPEYQAKLVAAARTKAAITNIDKEIQSMMKSVAGDRESVPTSAAVPAPVAPAAVPFGAMIPGTNVVNLDGPQPSAPAPAVPQPPTAPAAPAPANRAKVVQPLSHVSPGAMKGPPINGYTGSDPLIAAVTRAFTDGSDQNADRFAAVRQRLKQRNS